MPDSHHYDIEVQRDDQETPTPSDSKAHLERDRKRNELEHLEKRVLNRDTQFVDENLVRAENEDKVTPYLVFLIAVAAIAGFLFGYDTAVIGVALPHVGDDLGSPLTHGEQEIITAGCTIGAIFGASILGSLADRLGRRLALFIADIFFTVGAVIIAASYSVPQMIVGRLVLGVGVGAAGVIGPLYIAELAPTAIRGRCIGINAFFIPFGQAVASAIGAGLNDANPTLAWRLLFALGVVPSVIQLVLVHWLPESPRVLILRGQDDKARTAIRRIYRDASEPIIDLKLRICQEYVHATTVMQREYTLTRQVQRFWTHKPYRRAIISVSGVQAFGQLTGFNTLLYYSGTIFGLLGLSNPAAASLIPAGGNALFLFIGMLVVDRFGRRRLLVTFIPGMIAGLVWVTVTFVFMTRGTGNQLDANVTYEMKYVGNVLGALILFTCSFGLTYSHIVWYQSEFLALEIRAAGSAIATTACWIANLIVSISFLSMLNAMTPMGVYGFYLGLITIGYAFVHLCYPETKGLSIDETSLLFEHGFGVRKAQQMLKEKIELSKRFREAGQDA